MYHDTLSGCDQMMEVGVASYIYISTETHALVLLRDQDLSVR